MDIINVTPSITLPGRSPIRALHSLSEAQAAIITAGLADLAPEWCIERHESCDGHLSLVLTHTLLDASIVVDRDQAGIHVGLLLADELHTMPYGFVSASDALSAIRGVAGTQSDRLQRNHA